jgi:hypothetical protein
LRFSASPREGRGNEFETGSRQKDENARTSRVAEKFFPFSLREKVRMRGHSRDLAAADFRQIARHEPKT